MALPTYERLERGAARLDPTTMYMARAYAQGATRETLSAGEACTLLRRRQGIGQRDVARGIGVSRYWLQRMEGDLAHPGAMLKYWGFDDQG